MRLDARIAFASLACPANFALVAVLNRLFGFAFGVRGGPCYTGLDCKGECVFSDFAIWYLFLAGTAAGAFLWAAAIDMRGVRAFAQSSVPFRSRTGFHGCTMLLAFAALMLFLDLGNLTDTCTCSRIHCVRLCRGSLAIDALPGCIGCGFGVAVAWTVGDGLVSGA